MVSGLGSGALGVTGGRELDSFVVVDVDGDVVGRVALVGPFVRNMIVELISGVEKMTLSVSGWPWLRVHVTVVRGATDPLTASLKTVTVVRATVSTSTILGETVDGVTIMVTGPGDLIVWAVTMLVTVDTAASRVALRVGVVFGILDCSVERGILDELSVWA